MGSVIQEECRKSAVRRVRAFREEFGVKTVPVNCVRLLQTLGDSGKIRLKWILLQDEAPGFLDGMTQYISETDTYLVLTRRPPLNWRKYSSWRRYNFTLAHELGHVFLGHMKTPNELKSEAVRDMEDLEADAFAAELLAPAEALGRFRTVQEASEALREQKNDALRRGEEAGMSMLLPMLLLLLVILILIMAPAMQSMSVTQA